MRALRTLASIRRPAPGRARARLLPALPLLLAALAAGCGGHVKKALIADAPPETRLFVRGPVDTVNHVVHLYWFGSDPDGDVVGFEFRMLNPQLPADTTWQFTTRTDSIFTVWDPTGLTAPVFELRAVDNAGLRDPTPEIQNFTFSNQAPVVTIASRLYTSDSTYAAVTVSWVANDPDGDGARMTYRVWLKGDEANAYSTTARTFSVPSEAFFRVGRFEGFDTLYVQATDDAGRVGPTDQMTWYVRAAGAGQHGRLLIIDDVPTTNATNFATDTLYRNTAARNLPAGSYNILKLQYTQPFHSDSDLVRTFRQFDAVIWYRGTQTQRTSLLTTYESAISEYLDGGGNFMVEGLYLFAGTNVPGSMSSDFIRNHLDSDGLVLNFNTTLQDSTGGWGNANGARLVSSELQDSLQVGGFLPGLPAEVPGIEAFAVRDTHEVAIWAPPQQLAPGNIQRLPVAVMVRQPAGGRAVVTSIPIWPCRLYGTQARVLAKLFQRLGVFP